MYLPWGWGAEGGGRGITHVCASVHSDPSLVTRRILSASIQPNSRPYTLSILRNSLYTCAWDISTSGRESFTKYLFAEEVRDKRLMNKNLKFDVEHGGLCLYIGKQVRISFCVDNIYSSWNFIGWKDMHVLLRYQCPRRTGGYRSLHQRNGNPPYPPIQCPHRYDPLCTFPRHA